MKLSSKIFVFLCLFSVIGKAQIVRMETVLGNIDIELHPDAAPATVSNFLSYVNDNEYDNSFIHRSIINFVVQGGGFKFVGDQSFQIAAKPSVQNEFLLSNVRGTISMAKLPDLPNSATSQWFFNIVDNSFLDTQNGGFTVFGTVINGMDVVDAINALQTNTIAISIDDEIFNFSDVPYLNQRPSLLTENDAVIIQNIYSLLNINSGLNGAWFNPNTPGQGFLIEVLPTLESVFMAWFTYDTQAPTDTAVVGFAGHRWMTSLGSIDYENNTVTFDLFVTSNGLFDNNQAVNTSEANSVGILTITFEDCENAKGVYNLIEQELSGSFDLVRIAPDNVALCQSLSQSAAK